LNLSYDKKTLVNYLDLTMCEKPLEAGLARTLCVMTQVVDWNLGFDEKAQREYLNLSFDEKTVTVGLALVFKMTLVIGRLGQ
jgi:hypothetical protein